MNNSPQSPWFVTRRWQDSVIVQTDPAHVAVLFADPVAFIKINPTVVALAPVPGQPNHYTATERIPLLGFALHHRFPTMIRAVDNGVETEAWSFPKIHVRTRFAYAPHPQGTQITIDTTLTVFALLARFVANTAQRARQDTLRRLHARLAAG